MNWTAEFRKISQQVRSICGNSFKTVGKAFQVKLVERIPSVCMIPYVLFHSFDVFLLFYNVENSKNIQIHLNE